MERTNTSQVIGVIIIKRIKSMGTRSVLKAAKMKSGVVPDFQVNKSLQAVEMTILSLADQKSLVL